MYSEQIDTIEQGMRAYANDLRHIIRKICLKLAAIGKTDTINVTYYTDSEVQSLYFAVNGYDDNPESGYISRIENLNTLNPTFVVRGECTDFDDDFTVDDFTDGDILGVARLLNDILNVAKEDKEVIAD